MLPFGDGISVGFAIRVRGGADERKALRRGRLDYSVYVKEAIPYVVLGFTNGKGNGLEVIGHGNWWKSSAEERARLSIERNPGDRDPGDRDSSDPETGLDQNGVDLKRAQEEEVLDEAEDDAARVQREVMEHFRKQKADSGEANGRRRRSGSDRFRGVMIYLVDQDGWVVGIRKESMHRHHVERVRDALQAQRQRYASREEVDQVAIRTRQETSIQEIRERAGTYRVSTTYTG